MGGKQSSSNASTGFNFGYDANQSGGINQGFQQGGSQGTQFGQSYGNTIGGQNVWTPQGNALSDLYANIGQAANTASGYGPNRQAGRYINQDTNQLVRQGQQTIGALSSYDPSQQIQAQETSLRAGLDNLGAHRLNQLGADAAHAGAFGGARHGLTEAAAIGELGRAYTEGLGDITARANAQGIQANSAIGQMLPMMQGLRTNQAMTGQQLQLGNQQLAMNPYLASAQALGVGPTTLSFNQGQQGSTNFGQNNSFQNAFNNALNYSLGRGVNLGGQSGTGNSSGWNIANMFGTLF
ncbi:hypothetical protein [Primorskyibacter sp. S87]|uniref:hypothetical protein n=1 Tax=Primorskyibacter sp. S87 TaxID=3415126 RepID=UPI003C7BBB25